MNNYLKGRFQVVDKLRKRLGLGNVRLAVAASITRARADLLGLNVVVISAGVLVADFLDAADFDVGESGSVAVVGVDACCRVSALITYSLRE